MADAPKSKRTARDQAFVASQRLMKERPEFDDSWRLIIEEWIGIPLALKPSKTPDRTVAIVLAAIVEHALEHAIRTHFVISEEEGKAIFQGRSDEEAPLHSYASKIALGYALGVYDPILKNELKWIKNIRNAFAHSGRHLTFDTPEIALMVDALRTPGRVRWGGLLGVEPTTPRDKFIATVKLAFMYLAIDLPDEALPKRYGTSEWYQRIFLRRPKPSS